MTTRPPLTHSAEAGFIPATSGSCIPMAMSKLPTVERMSSSAAARTGPDTILAVEPWLRPERGEQVIDGQGGALIPGLHDHHVHPLQAAVAARLIVDVTAVISGRVRPRGRRRGRDGCGGCGSDGPEVGPGHRLARASGRAAEPGSAGHADWPGSRSGAAPKRCHVGAELQPPWTWSAPCAATAGVERDERGELTGRSCCAIDGWLREHLPADRGPQAGSQRNWLATPPKACGSGSPAGRPTPPRTAIRRTRRSSPASPRPALFRQRLVLDVGGQPDSDPAGRGPEGGRRDVPSHAGPVKVMLDDLTLPSAGQLAHGHQGRARLRPERPPHPLRDCRATRYLRERRWSGRTSM